MRGGGEAGIITAGSHHFEIGIEEFGESMKTDRAVSRLVVVGALVFGLSSVSLFAGGPVTVSGSVTDINGNPLRNVEVSALAEGGDGPVTTQSKKNWKASVKAMI